MKETTALLIGCCVLAAYAAVPMGVALCFIMSDIKKLVRKHGKKARDL